MHSISGHISLDDSANQIFLPEGKIIYICFCLYYESFFWIKKEKKIGLTGDLYLNIKEDCPQKVHSNNNRLQNILSNKTGKYSAIFIWALQLYNYKNRWVFTVVLAAHTATIQRKFNLIFYFSKNSVAIFHPDFKSFFLLHCKG